MKNQTFKLFLIFTGLFVFLTAQNTPAQERSEYIDLNYILAKLTFTSRISKSTEQINDELIKEIRERKVDFVLVNEKEKEIEKAGGNELLIKTIHENPQKEIKAAFDENAALYQQYLDNYKGNIEQKKIAIKAGKEYIEKYGDDADFKPQIEYLKKAILELENIVNCCEPDIDPKYYREFDQAFKNKNWDDLFETGAKILDREPEFVDIALVLASVGFDSLVENKDKTFLRQTLYYAEKSIKLLESGAKSERYGVFEYEYKTKEFPDGRANALGWMHYFIGYIKHFHFSQREQAVSYLYKSITYKSETRERPIIYVLIGEFYQNELFRLEQQEKRQIESYPDNTPERDAKTNALLDRAIDAFARAYFAAKSEPETDKKTLQIIFDKLQELLKMRDKNKSTFDFDKLISNIIAKPMPDPADGIIPVK